MPPRTILHADMDAFYASIEQRDHPELRGLPVIVGATSARGVVAAASYEARRFGIRSAMPGFRARALCPDGISLPSNMAHYAAVSAEVHRIFHAFTPDVEPVALDEAFLDVTGTAHLFGGPAALGLELKRRVRAEVDLAVSVGIAPSKLVAKIACTLSKPDGLSVVTPDAVRALLDPLPIRRLWGIGPVLGADLEKLGIHTIQDLRSFDLGALERVVGARAHSLKALARGEDDRPVESDREPKSYGEESTFEVDLGDRDRVTEALTAHAEAVARRLRADDYRGRTVTLKIKLGKRRGYRASRLAGEPGDPIYPLLSRSHTLENPTDDGAVIRDVAVSLWDAAKVEEPVRLLGVSVSNLVSRRYQQLDLFPSRTDRLGPTLDAITRRFGREAITRAVPKVGKITATRSRKRGEDPEGGVE